MKSKRVLTERIGNEVSEGLTTDCLRVFECYLMIIDFRGVRGVTLKTYKNVMEHPVSESKKRKLVS